VAEGVGYETEGEKGRFRRGRNTRRSSFAEMQTRIDALEADLAAAHARECEGS
jgi:hypothetical protein